MFKSGSFMLLSAALSAQSSPNIGAYVTPFEFCSTQPPGKYCDPGFPRSTVECPSGVRSVCDPHFSCSPGIPGSVECVPNFWDPYINLCYGKPKGASYCYQNTTVQCDSGELFLCPSDLRCKRRGYRAYCVQPQFLLSEPTTGFCKGINPRKKTKICHPLNLKKIISCPSEDTISCDIGQMCNADSTGLGAKCVPYQSDLNRFCQNKPIFSSQCIYGSPGQFIMCSQEPQIFQCPSKHCIQNRTITAVCVE